MARFAPQLQTASEGEHPAPLLQCRVTTLRALRRPVAPALLRVLRRLLPACRFDAAAVETVLHEVMTNAAVHGNLGLAGAADGGLASLESLSQQIEHCLRQAALARRPIELTVAVQPGCLLVTVRDEGPGFKEDLLLAPDRDRPHGRGIHLMRALARSVTYRDGGREVCVVFDMCDADAPA